MSHKVLVLATLAAALASGPLSASGIDPFSPDDFPAPTLTDGLELMLPSPVCFDNGGVSECLEDAWMIPTTGVTDTYDYLGTEEHDVYSVHFYADLYENGIFQRSLTLSGSVETVDERTSPGEYGPHNSEMIGLDLTGNDPVLGPVHLRETADSTPTGTTDIEPLPGGYGITSFFDVFTEISIGGGNTWLPSTTGATEIDLAPRMPEPGSVFLLSAGVFVLAGRLRRRV